MGFSQLMLIGRVLTDGRVNARVKCDLTDNLSLKANAQVSFCYCHSSSSDLALLSRLGMKVCFSYPHIK